MGTAKQDGKPVDASTLGHSTEFKGDAPRTVVEVIRLRDGCERYWLERSHSAAVAEQLCRHSPNGKSIPPGTIRRTPPFEKKTGASSESRSHERGKGVRWMGRKELPNTVSCCRVVQSLT